MSPILWSHTTLSVVLSLPCSKFSTSKASSSQYPDEIVQNARHMNCSTTMHNNYAPSHSVWKRRRPRYWKWHCYRLSVSYFRRIGRVCIFIRADIHPLYCRELVKCLNGVDKMSYICCFMRYMYLIVRLLQEKLVFLKIIFVSSEHSI